MSENVYLSLLINELSSFKRGFVDVVDCFSEVTGLDCNVGIDIGFNCKDENVINIIKLLGTDRVFTTSYKDKTIIVYLPCTCEDYMSNARVVYKWKQESMLGNQSMTYHEIWGTAPYPIGDLVSMLNNEVLLCLEYDSVTIYYNSQPYSFNYEILSHLDKILDILENHLEEFNLVQCFRSLISSKRVIDSIFYSDSDFIDSLIDEAYRSPFISNSNLEYGDLDDYGKYIVNALIKIKELNLDHTLITRLVALCYLQHSGIAHKRIVLSSWCNLLEDNTLDVVSYNYGMCDNLRQGFTINQSKDLPKLLLYAYTSKYVGIEHTEVIKKVELELNGYASMSRNFFKRPIEFNGLYFDGNLSKERAIKKFVKAVEDLGMNLSDFIVQIKCDLSY